MDRCTESAFRMASVAPSDIQVGEIYDCVTYAVIRQIEDMGFCAKGDGGAFVEAGRLERGGALAIMRRG